MQAKTKTMVSIPISDAKIILEQLKQQVKYYEAIVSPEVNMTEEETQADIMKKRMVEAGMATYE